MARRTIVIVIEDGRTDRVLNFILSSYWVSKN